MTPERTYTVPVSRLRLNVVEWGPADGTPLMLVHGGKDHARNWDFVAGRLAHRYRIIAPDLRGHGDSDWSADGDYTFSDHVADLAQLIETLRLPPFRLVGHSMGAAVVTRYAGLFPERLVRLVNIEGLGVSPELQIDELRAWVRGRGRLLAREARPAASIEDAADRLSAFNPRLSPDMARHLAVTGTRPQADGTFAFKHDPAMGHPSPADIPNALKYQLWSAITCPVLLIYGAQSWAKSPALDGRIDRFQNARLEVFEDAGHWIQHDQLDGFVAAVEAFLA